MNPARQDLGVVVISGGSRGLGACMARHLLELGAPVAAFARNATDEVRQLTDQHAGRFFFTELDACDSAAVERFLDSAAARWGGIRALVNNAAVGQDHLFAHLPERRLEEIIDINLKASLLLTRSVVRRLLLQGRGGRIVTITSIGASQGYAGLTVYSATKGALESFTRALARELGARGILVNAIAPGFFRTEMSRMLSAEQVDTIRRRTPTERLIDAGDVLPVLDLLLFGEVNLTGQVLRVDGGASS